MKRSEITDLAAHEFDAVFGSVARELDEGEGTVFYSFFLGEFLAGVEFALSSPTRGEEEVEVEAAVRYFISPEKDFSQLEPESQAMTGRGSSLVFRYGAHWALSCLSGGPEVESS